MTLPPPTPRTGPRAPVIHPWPGPVPGTAAVALPPTFGDAVRAESGRALRPPYTIPSTVAANGAFMTVAWFFLPRGLKDDLFTLHGIAACSAGPAVVPPG